VLDESGHDTTSSLDTHGEGSNVEQEKVLGLLGGVARENGGLDGSTISMGLTGVDGLVRLLAVEEVRDKLYNTRDMGGATDEENLVDVWFVDLRVTENFLDEFERVSEEILAQLLETSMGERCVEVDTLKQGVDFDGGLGGGRKSTWHAHKRGKDNGMYEVSKINLWESS
jgi:hypothetical protein